MIHKSSTLPGRAEEKIKKVFPKTPPIYFEV